MSYQDPQPQPNFLTFVGLDAVLQGLVDDFSLAFPWLQDKVFRRVVVNKFPDEQGDAQKSPVAYISGGEYYDASINDNIACAAFFQAAGPEAIVFEKPRDRKHVVNRRPCAMVFWCDLRKIADIFEADDYIFTENIKAEFLKVIAKNRDVSSITQYIDEPFDAVFDGFDFDEENQYAKYPFASMRINFTIEYHTCLY